MVLGRVPVAGVLAAGLVRLGNPVDGGLSVACPMRDLAGVLGLHPYEQFSYLRPELAGMVLAACLTAVLKRSFNSESGGMPGLRFIAGTAVALPVFVFIGCPMRMFQRLAFGDPAAIAAGIGLAVGVFVGTALLKRGFSWGPSRPAAGGWSILVPVAAMFIAVFGLFRPAFLSGTVRGHAPFWTAFAAGVVVGALAQRTKLCFIGGLRNLFAVGDLTLLTGAAGFTTAVWLAGAALGLSHPGITRVGLDDWFWSGAAMFAVGLGSTLLGGCPFRQLILASQGRVDAALVLLGVMTGAAAAYRTDIAFIAGSLEPVGKIAVIAVMLVFAAMGALVRRR